MQRKYNVSCFDYTVNFTIFQKVIASRVYIFSGCDGDFLKELFFLFVIPKAFFFWPAKASARRKCVRVILRVSPFYLLLLAVVLLG